MIYLAVSCDTEAEPFRYVRGYLYDAHSMPSTPKQLFTNASPILRVRIMPGFYLGLACSLKVCLVPSTAGFSLSCRVWNPEPELIALQATYIKNNKRLQHIGITKVSNESSSLPYAIYRRKQEIKRRFVFACVFSIYVQCT